MGTLSRVLPLAFHDRLLQNARALSDYAFAWGEDVPGFDAGKECAIGLGYLGLAANHAKPSNVRLERHYADNQMSIHALRDIAPGEELTIDYDIPLWFAPS